MRWRFDVDFHASLFQKGKERKGKESMNTKANLYCEQYLDNEATMHVMGEVRNDE